MSEFRRQTPRSHHQSQPALASRDVLHLTRAASPQFVVPIVVRVIRVLDDRHPPHGWEWIDCYQLNAAGDAVARRSLFVLVEGVEHLTSWPAGRRGPAPVRPPTAPGSRTAPSRRSDNQRRGLTRAPTVRQ